MFRRDIKKAMWMLDQNKEFYKFVEKIVGSQFAAENGIMYELDMDLINLERWEKKVENREIDEFDLKDNLNMMGRKTMLPILGAIDGLNVMYNFNITGFEEEIDEEKTEGDVKSEEMIKEKIEERNKKIEEEKGMSKKQRRNQKLARRKDEKKKKKLIEKREKEIEGIKKEARKSKEVRRLNENEEVKELAEIEPKEKESETDAEQNEKDKNTDCFGKIPMGAKVYETQDKMCNNKYRESLLYEVDNREVDDIEVKEIGI